MFASFSILTFTPALFVLKTSATTKSKETDKHIQLIKMKISTLTGNLVFVCLFFFVEAQPKSLFLRFEILADFQC